MRQLSALQPSRVIAAVLSIIMTGLALLATVSPARAAEEPAMAGVEQVSVAADTFYIMNDTFYLMNDNSSKCMGVSGSSNSNGAPSIQWTCAWQLMSDQGMDIYQYGGPNSIWHTINPRHNTGKCLGISGSSPNRGASLIQWTCGSPAPAADQLFAFREIKAGIVEIIAGHTGQLLAVSNAGTANGARIIQWSWAGSPEQFWHVFLA